MSSTVDDVSEWDSSNDITMDLPQEEKPSAQSSNDPGLMFNNYTKNELSGLHDDPPRPELEQWPKEEKEQKWQAPFQKTFLRLGQQASAHQTTHRPQKTQKKATSATQQKNRRQQQPQVSTQSHVRQRFVQSWVWQGTARAHASTPRPYPSGTTTIGRVRPRRTVVQSHGSSNKGHFGRYVAGF